MIIVVETDCESLLWFQEGGAKPTTTSSGPLDVKDQFKAMVASSLSSSNTSANSDHVGTSATVLVNGDVPPPSTAHKAESNTLDSAAKVWWHTYDSVAVEYHFIYTLALLL